ncbi:glycoside hydrolase family 19 protein [Phenylobacterium sp. 58.2.17]|uniref:glycoside hydrolase family 19 protein n=1 Tax=Phenylobacterium sp. 58.2.17 TaxID=2969306 RepID=UPI0022651972|nr:hypothetical protein [Phenylobacterium sp. 58.2.17]MCX7586560.1 hypothetical protein [Phenylobacterium sp. 58.2.17]
MTTTDAASVAITAERLLFVEPRLSREAAAPHAAALEAARPLGDLTTPARVRHFIAQAAHETQGFTRLRENMRYRDPATLDKLFKKVRDLAHARQLIAAGPEAIANCVYADRYGNGGPETGDGHDFRGGGYLHITFRDNYRAVGRATGMDLEGSPQLLENPTTAAQAAARFWKWKKINAAADRDDVRAVTALINPALVGLDDRRAYLGRARLVWP